MSAQSQMSGGAIVEHLAAGPPAYALQSTQGQLSMMRWMTRRFLYIPLFNAERAWAYAQQFKKQVGAASA